MDSAFIIKLIALVLLVEFLLYRQWRRERRRAALRRQLRPSSEGLDVAPLRPRLVGLRQNFLRVAQEHVRGGHARAGLVTAARRRLARLAFFRDQPAHPEREHRVA